MEESKFLGSLELIGFVIMLGTSHKLRKRQLTLGKPGKSKMTLLKQLAFE